MDDLGSFLWQVKKSSYAVNGDFFEKDGIKHFIFRHGFYRFEDRKIGDQYYSGQEVVYKDKKPVWTMAYSGGLLTEDVAEEAITAFINEALIEEKNRNLIRGPSFFQKENFIYLNEFQGDVTRFNGREYIRYEGKNVYELHYSGGNL